VVVAGVGLHPVPVITGALTEHFFAHHREAQNLTDEIHHLLGSRQTTQVAVNDDAIEAVIDEGQQISE
jgi:ferritin-like metal-binding protein YciE